MSTNDKAVLAGQFAREARNEEAWWSADWHRMRPDQHVPNELWLASVTYFLQWVLGDSTILGSKYTKDKS